MSNVILVIAALAALAWTALAIRLINLSRGKWFRFLEPIEGPIGHAPSVNAIVPARNEEANVEATVEAIRAQDYPNLTLTVVDDQSTDSTAEILDRLSRDPNVPLRFIRGVERPQGWVGKTWAVHQGATDSTAEWLWFVDADMGLHPRALASAMAEADSSGSDFVSLLPGVRCRTFWQGTIASSLLQLLGQLYPLDRVNDPARPEAIAAGGFILVRRSVYELAGGHEAVRRAIIEDIQLARRVKETGGKLVVRLAPVLAWTHMYGSFGQIWQGLRKNAYAGMDYMPHKYVTGAVIALILAWSPWIALAIGLKGGIWGNGVVGAWGIAAQAVASAPILIFLGLPAVFALTLPVGITAYVAIASSSVWHHHRGRILWKDRTIPSNTVAVSRPGEADETGENL
jgi:cellulose synthase/poly-beta-1,6-N-acetylglucosamine synthase-like glycosyltransferase